RQKDPELFYSSLKEARKQLEAQAFRSEEYFRQRSVHDTLVLEASIIRYHDYKARHLQLDDEQLIAAQDIYVAMDVLMLEMSRVGREDAHPEMASSAHEVLKKYSQQPVAVLLCLLFECMNRTNGISREEALLLCDTWEKTAPLIHPDNRSNYYILVLNVLIKRLNTATREEMKRTLAVYEDIINHPSIPFQRQHYYNLIRLCIRLTEDPAYESDKEFFLKKAHEILEDFKSKLPEHGREDYYLYNRAHIYFAQKNFNALRAQMPEMKAFDLAYESNYRLLWLQSLYELDDKDYRLSAQLSSLEQWVARQRWHTDRQKMQHLNAVSFFRKLVNASPGNRDRLIILRNDLAGTPDCNRKEWLNQKLNEKIATATRRR
ncbi:MAG: hypothetical protein EAZ89_07765, partial [Bacteroidetes bacterium]